MHAVQGSRVQGAAVSDTPVSLEQAQPVQPVQLRCHALPSGAVAAVQLVLGASLSGSCVPSSPPARLSEQAAAHTSAGKPVVRQPILATPVSRCRLRECWECAELRGKVAHYQGEAVWVHQQYTAVEALAARPM